MTQRKQNLAMPILLVGGGLLLIIAAVLFAIQTTSTAPASAPSHDEETHPEIPRVPLDEAKSALDSASAIFVDVRSAEAYQASHIAGAINIPLAELELRISELNPNQWIITYCT